MSTETKRGPGRPPLGFVQMSIRLTPEAAEALKALADAKGITYGEAVMGLLAARKEA